MIIINTPTHKSTQFDKLVKGDTFLHSSRNILYIRISEIISANNCYRNAIELSTGELTYFSYDEEVTKVNVNAEIVFES